MVRLSSAFYKHRHAKPSSAAAQAPAATTFESTMMEDDVAAAEAVVLKWAVDGSDYSRTTSLFHESREEARRFLQAVAALQRAMCFFVGSRDRHGQEVIARAQRLTKTAMARLQKEFYQLLAANQHQLDPESLHRSSISTSTSCSSLEDMCSLDEELGPDQQPDDLSPSTSYCPSPSQTQLSSGNHPVTSSDQQQLLISDLRSIAETMVTTGYAKECFNAYEAVRRSNVEEGLLRLGFPRVSSAQPHRLGGNSDTRLSSWPHAARYAVRSLFSAERILCDGIFGFSESVRESVFAEITGEGAASFFAFPETAAKAARKSPEKTFELLDVYGALVDLLPEIEILFSHKSTARVTAQAVTSLNKIAEAVRSTLAEFESAVRKYTSKGPVPGGSIHPLTRYVMNYLAFLADYVPALEEIFADHPLSLQKPLPDYFFFPSSSSFTPPTSSLASPSRGFGEDDYEEIDDQDARHPDDTSAAPGNVAPRVAWLLLILLCRLDGKAELYQENVPLAYLFLANNLNYVTSKVRKSELRHLLGAGWVTKYEEKARYYARTYLKQAWEEVAESIPADPHAVLAAADQGAEAIARMMRRFNLAFEGAYRRQVGWVVPDGRMRDELKKYIARKVMLPYVEFYDTCRPVLVRAGFGADVCFAPEDVGNYLSDLFYGHGGSRSASASPGRSSESRYSKRSSWWRSR